MAESQRKLKIPGLRRAFDILHRQRIIFCILIVALCLAFAPQAGAGSGYDSVGSTFETAESMMESGNTDSALRLYATVIAAYSDDMPDELKAFCARARMRQGEIYERQNRYSDALEAYVTGMMISEKCRGNARLMEFYKKIGNIYSKFGDHGRAFGIYKDGYALRESHPDRKTECDILFNLVFNCYVRKDLPQARKYLALAKGLVDPGDPVKVFLSHYADGLLLIGENPDAGIRKMKEAAALAPDDVNRCFAYDKIYIGYRNQQNPDSCLRYLQLCNTLATANGMTEMTAQTLKDLAQYYETRDPGKAAYYRNRYKEMADSILSSAYDLNKFFQVRNTQYLYELEKTDRRISDLQTQQRAKEREIRFQRTLTLILFGVLVMAAVFIWIVMRQKKKLAGAYRNLFSKNNELMKNESDSKALISGYEERIQELEIRLAACENVPRQEETTETSRYHASSLNEENKRRILGRLTKIMDEEKAFCSADFSLGRLAELAGTNQAYLSQVINESCGKNFSEYVNEYRIREVCSRLLDTAGYGNLTIEAIAESVGFKSRSTFSRTFRKITGIPPSVYQKMSAARTRDTSPS